MGRWNRETWQPGTMFPSLIWPSHAVCYALMSRKTTELYVKVFQQVQQLVPRFAPTCAMADFEEASVAGFFLYNRLCQITACADLRHYYCYTFPSANTYLCCWRCLLVNNIWLYDYAFNVAFNCVCSCLIWPKIHLARLDTTRHVRRVKPMHFGCVELVEQHRSTRSTRRARLARLALVEACQVEFGPNRYVRCLVSLRDVEPSMIYKTTQWWPENVGLDIERAINQSLYRYFIVRPNADFTNSPLSLSQVGIIGSDPGPFTPNVLDFLTFWIDTLIFRNVL